MTSNQHWMQRDLKVLWHPCTQMKDHEQLPIIPIEKGEGVWLHDFDGNKYIDAVSSWWVNIFGHSNPHINKALSNQAENLEHVILGGFTHKPVIELAEKLVEITPAGLDKCFFADNGSSAIEVALKMSFHYWRNKGKTEKTRFISLSNSYHGETIGALSVGDVALYKETYEPLLLKTINAKAPDCFDCPDDMSWEEYCTQEFIHMEQTLAKHAHEACAVIVEPLVQCAGNMRMYHPIYLELLREACDRHGVHLIADEIAVGFGRTGTMFACEQANITPDFMCISKGLTAGYLPLAVTLTTNEIYEAFYDKYETLKAFLHSHSYTGNALGCSVALATLELFKKNDTINKNSALAAAMCAATAHLTEHPNVAEIRQTGMIQAIELVKDKKTREQFDWKERRGLRVFQHGLENQALLRPLGNVIYLMPPYVITEEQIQHLADVITSGIEIAVK